MTANIRGLDHWAIVTKDQDRCIAFYEGVLGLKVGPRPQLTFQGVWFYAGQTPIVHVISDRPFESGKTGAFDHIAGCGRDQKTVRRCTRAEKQSQNEN